jgi:hypothetical protein
MLAAAERPLVLVGGAQLADAVDDPAVFADLNRLSVQWLLPISPTHRRSQLFTATHPNHGGYMGIRVPPALKGVNHPSAKGLPVKHPMMHRTRSLDYAVILSGEIDMMLDDTTVHLKQGDVVIQQATRERLGTHWRERRALRHQTGQWSVVLVVSTSLCRVAHQWS